MCTVQSIKDAIRENCQLIIPGFQRTLVAVERTLTAL